MSPDTMIPNEGLRLVKSDRNPNPDDEVVDLSRIYQAALERAVAASIQHALGEHVLVYPDHYTQEHREKVRTAAKVAINSFLPDAVLDARLRAREDLALIAYKKDYALLDSNWQQLVNLTVDTVWMSIAASLSGVTARLEAPRVKELQGGL